MSNTLTHQDLSPTFISEATYPQVISIVFDGTEVHRIEDGIDIVSTEGFSPNYLPNVLQQYWDEELVLELFPKLNLVTVNRLVPDELNLAEYATIS